MLWREKRKLCHTERERYGALMTKEKHSASRVKKSEAAILMKPGDVSEPSDLPTLNALRIIKHRSQTAEHLDPDPIISIIKMMQNQPYKCFFQNVGYEPFFLHYWSAAQTNAYRTYTRQTKVPCVSIDATVSLIRRINLLSDRRTRAIFLYQVVVCDDNGQYPVAEMLSERHHNIAIGHWLLS